MISDSDAHVFHKMFSIYFETDKLLMFASMLDVLKLQTNKLDYYKVNETLFSGRFSLLQHRQCLFTISIQLKHSYIFKNPNYS